MKRHFQVARQEPRNESGLQTVYLWTNGDHFVALNRATGLDKADFKIIEGEFDFFCERGSDKFIVTELDQYMSPIRIKELPNRKRLSPFKTK